MIRKIMSEDENKARVLSAINEVTGKSYNGVMVGYKPSLDRHTGAAVTGDMPGGEGEKKGDISDLLKRAREGGVEVEEG